MQSAVARAPIRRLLLPLRIGLPMLAAAARCFRAQTLTNDQGALEHSRTPVNAAEILAAAITLRDSRGRDRKDALRRMANAWGVTVNEKVGGKYKPRPNSALEEDIQASVCKAALDWESGAV